MFYEKELLSRRRGKFGVIWQAGTLGSGKTVSLTRRDYQKVVISTACSEIQNLVIPKQALALRLSSNLMVGVLRVYRQQTLYIWVDTRHVWSKVRAMSELRNELSSIDMPPNALKRNDPLVALSGPSIISTSDFDLFIDFPAYEKTLTYIHDLTLPTALQMELVWTLDSPLLGTSHSSGDDRDGEVSFASLADVTGDISLGSIDDIKIPNDEDFAGPAVTKRDADTHDTEIVPETEEPNLLDDIDLQPPFDRELPGLMSVGEEQLVQDLQEAADKEPTLGMVDGAQFGLSFPGAARPSTPATFSISNFELEPLPASHPKPKKPVKKGPLINQEISLTDDVIKTNIQHGRDLIVDRRPLLNFDFPLAADLFSKPTFEYGSDILNTWSMAAVLPMGEARFFDNFLADDQLMLESSAGVDHYGGGVDDTLESLERARHLDSRGEEGLASLGGSDLSVSKSKSNLMLDSLQGSFPVERGSLDNLSGLLRDPGPSAVVTSADTADGRSSSTGRRHRFSTAAPVLHQIAEEESVLLAGFDPDHSAPITFDSGAGWLKRQDSVNDFLQFLDSAMGSRDTITFSRLVPPDLASRKTAATALSTLLTLMSENVVDMVQASPAHSVVITRGAEF